VNDEKHIGLDVHQASIVVAVMDSTGKLVMESILETKAATILQFFAGLRGTLLVIFEEGTCSAWLYDLLLPRGQTGSVQSVQERAAQRWEQEPSHRCAQAGQSVRWQPSQTGLPRRNWRAYVAGTIPELSDRRQRSVAGDESAESGVPQLGDSLCGQRCPLPPAYTGAQDRSHYADALEKRENFDAEKLKSQAA
jgi:hypothetical protein